MGELIFGALAVVFLFSFGFSLYVGLEFSRDLNRFTFQFHYGMMHHKKIDFNGPSFNFRPFFILVFAANTSLALIQFTISEPIEEIRFILFYAHYPIFLVWVIERNCSP